MVDEARWYRRIVEFLERAAPARHPFLSRAVHHERERVPRIDERGVAPAGAPRRRPQAPAAPVEPTHALVERVDVEGRTLEREVDDVVAGRTGRGMDGGALGAAGGELADTRAVGGVDGIRGIGR